MYIAAGQERFRSVTHAYYRDAHGKLFSVSSVHSTNPQAFDDKHEWQIIRNEFLLLPTSRFIARLSTVKTKIIKQIIKYWKKEKSGRETRTIIIIVIQFNHFFTFSSSSTSCLAILKLAWWCTTIAALLLLYDVTNKTSFDNIRAWLVEIREYAQDDVVIMLLGKALAMRLVFGKKKGAVCVCARRGMPMPFMIMGATALLAANRRRESCL